jgi:mycothione reductase
VPHFSLVIIGSGSGNRDTVGAHIMGEQASLLIQPLIQAAATGQRLAHMARGQYWIHPALSEVVENALLELPLDPDSAKEGAVGGE